LLYVLFLSQLKFVINDELGKKFKQIVLAKHGKINLRPEGGEAIKLHIEKNEELPRNRAYSEEGDPIKGAIEIVKPSRVHDALEDLK
jgi:hypothetical protein